MTQSSTLEAPETIAPPHDSELIWQPPSQDELPYDDGEPIESHRHRLQMELLISPLLPHFPEREMFAGGNMFVYYRATEAGRRDSIGPDVFVVLDVPRGMDRKSWVIWNKGKAPDVVIELLSESTAAADRTSKKLIYQDILRVPEYFFYDPYSGERAGFSLGASGYKSIAVDERDQLVSQRLQLALVRWEGVYQDTTATWLRWATLDGALLPTEYERADQERQRADHEQQRADDLAAQLARYRERFGDLDGGS